MSLGKLPVFKNLMANSHGKRRFKSELTTDMISSPLGDFRHTMHVGRGGDVFGDTSFLSDHGGEKAQESAKANPLVRALRNVRKPHMRSRNSAREMSPPPAVSPIIKNAVSLPHLLETKNGSVERFNFKSVMSSPDVLDGSYGLQSGFCTLPRWSRTDKPKENATVGEPGKSAGTADVVDFDLPRTDSLLSFSLDLGPSLMSEVLGVMEKEPAGSGGPAVMFDLQGSPGPGHAEGPHPEPAGLGAGGPPGAEADGSRGRPSRRFGGTEGACLRDGGREVIPPAGGAADRRCGWGRPRGRPGAQEAERRAPGSWGAHSPEAAVAAGQRVPADGEEMRDEGHRERPLSPAQETAFSPVKTEAFAFADEEDEIRV